MSQAEIYCYRGYLFRLWSITTDIYDLLTNFILRNSKYLLGIIDEQSRSRGVEKTDQVMRAVVSKADLCRSARCLAASMHRRREQFSSCWSSQWNSDEKNAAANCSRRRHGSRTPIARKACDNAAPPCLVVLHLRARYVSKAAILTLPIRFVPVENRSPA